MKTHPGRVPRRVVNELTAIRCGYLASGAAGRKAIRLVAAAVADPRRLAALRASPGAAELSIEAPAAAKDETVEVLNYRRRPAVWETGVVGSLRYEAMHGPQFRWSYDVYIQREDGSGYPVRVGNDGIRKLTP